ncbi:MAG: glycosyltransferase family 4 protein [Chloroflexi bacterium]|nr:glycosyltransferase family 4 protein [Chloroflexota bacterium]
MSLRGDPGKSPGASVLVIPLGEHSPRQVTDVVSGQFPAATVSVLDRHALRRRPLRTIAGLLAHRFDAAVLVADDLSQPRLRLTSLVLLLARARSRWRIDQHGGHERWTVDGHATRDGGVAVRHLLGCALALGLSEPLLRALDAGIRPRELGGPGQPAPEETPTIAAHANRPPRVLYLRSQLWLGLAGGGSVAHTAGVIGGLIGAGAEVRAVASDRLAGVAAPTEVIRPEVWFDGWPRELEDLAYNVAFTLHALRAARRFRPDLVYQRHTAFNVSGAVLSRVLGVPLILEFNSSEVWKGRYWGGLRLERAAMLVERINLRAADRVIVVSRALRDELLGKDVPTAKIILNPNGVESSVFRPDLSGQQVRQQLGAASDVVVGFSGTFGAWHGVPTLAAAIGLVLQARPHVRWLLVGDGPLRPLVDQAVPDGPLAERVVRVGMRSHAEMPAYLAACDVLVSPHGTQADGGEFFGSPTKLYEYMAAGRPIVASRLGQIAEVLTDEQTALLVSPDDPTALAQAVVRLADDACFRARLAAAARTEAEAHHTWRRNAERVLACLNELASPRSETKARPASSRSPIRASGGDTSTKNAWPPDTQTPQMRTQDAGRQLTRVRPTASSS